MYYFIVMQITLFVAVKVIEESILPEIGALPKYMPLLSPYNTDHKVLLLFHMNTPPSHTYDRQM